MTNGSVTVEIHFLKKKPPEDSIPMYNYLFAKVSGNLGMVQFKNSCFDPNSPIPMPGAVISIFIFIVVNNSRIF